MRDPAKKLRASNDWYHRQPRTPCLDCGTTDKGIESKRCRICSGKSRLGANHPNWTGGRTLNAGGYVVLSGQHDHPNACMPYGTLQEHTKVMSEILGRPLLAGESVHHKNGVRHDNRPENLELWRNQRPGQRVEDMVEYLRSAGWTCVPPSNLGEPTA